MFEGLKSQVDVRSFATLIEAEFITIPSVEPYRKIVNELPEELAQILITRLTAAERLTSYGSPCDMTVLGWYKGSADREYRVVIDTGGDVGVATFKWSRNGGVGWVSTLIPIEDTDPIDLEDGISIQFGSDPTQTDYVVGETWRFYAEKWTEVTNVPDASKEYYVNYVNGMVEFYSGDAGKQVHAKYYGRGSIVSADDVNQLIDWIKTGSLVVGGLDTSDFQKGDLVGHDKYQENPTYSKMVKAFAGTGLTQALAFGMVVRVHGTEGEVQLFGLVHNPRSYTVEIEAGRDYFLSELNPGEWTINRPTLGGSFVQPVAVGIDDDTILIGVSLKYTINDYLIQPIGIQSGEQWGTPTVTLG